MKRFQKYLIPETLIFSLTIALTWMGCEDFGKEEEPSFNEVLNDMAYKTWQLDDVDIDLLKRSGSNYQYETKLRYSNSTRTMTIETIPFDDPNAQKTKDTVGYFVEELEFDNHFNSTNSDGIRLAGATYTSIELNENLSVCLRETKDMYKWGFINPPADLHTYIKFENPSDSLHPSPVLSTFFPYPRTEALAVLDLFEYKVKFSTDKKTLRLEFSDYYYLDKERYNGFIIYGSAVYKRVKSTYCSPLATGGNGINCDTSAVPCVNGTLIASEDSSRCICECDPGWSGTACDQTALRTTGTVAGSGTQGFMDGTLHTSQFNRPSFLIQGLDGFLYITDAGNHVIRRIRTNNTVETFAGTGAVGNQDGPGNQATFNSPQGITMDPQGNFYVADQVNHLIRKIEPNGTVSTLAGNGVAGFLDGNLFSARFNSPTGILWDKNGLLGSQVLLVTESDNNCIRKIDLSTGTVSLFAGSPLGWGNRNGPAMTAQFKGPTSLAMDNDGNVYVADANNNAIRKIATTNGQAGEVTTYAGTRPNGTMVGLPSNDPYWYPFDISWSAPNLLYVSDSRNNRIRLLTDSGNGYGADTDIAGNPGNLSGYQEGVGGQALFNLPEGIYLNADNILYVCDRNNHVIRSLSP